MMMVSGWRHLYASPARHVMTKTVCVVLTKTHETHVTIKPYRNTARDCRKLTSETVKGAALAFQSVHYVHGGDGLPLRVLGVGDSVADHVLEEHLQHTASLLVDQTGDTLHASSASETTDGGLRDTLDVITEYLPVTLGTTFSQSLSSLTATGHLDAMKSVSHQRMNVYVCTDAKRLRRVEQQRRV